MTLTREEVLIARSTPEEVRALVRARLVAAGAHHAAILLDRLSPAELVILARQEEHAHRPVEPLPRVGA